MLTTLLSNYVATGRLVLASWQQDLKTREKALEQVSSNFTSSGKLSLPQNLMWNVIMYCVFVMALFPSTQMSQDMYRFTCLHFLAPLLVGHLTFYRYRFGSKLWTHLTPTSWVVWTSHFAAVTGVALAGLTPTAALYIAGLVVDPYLPESCRGHVHFSLQDHERSLQASVYFFWILAAVLLVTLPVWKRGYELNMSYAGKQGEESTISYPELVMDLLYQTSGAPSTVYFATLFITIVQEKFGLRVHFVHIFMAAMDGLCSNFTLQYNYNIFHELFHRIPAFYNMVHREHHMPKSIFPANSGTALWEDYAHGGFANFAAVFLFVVPFFGLQLIFGGLSFIPHTMFPWSALAHWHPLHHTAQADIYSNGVPSAIDKQRSTFYKTHAPRLKEISIMFRNMFLPDLVALAMMIFVGAIFHYGFGTGLFHLDWSSSIQTV